MNLNECVVLVVEDEPLVALMVEDMLVEMGCRVAAVVHTEASAKQALIDHALDIAILDFEIGRSNSLELLAQCQAGGIGVVLATGYQASDLPAHCQSLPILAKPFSFEQLNLAVEQAIMARAKA